MAHGERADTEAAPAPAAAADAEPSDAESSDIGIAVDKLIETADAILNRLERLESENAFLRGQASALLAIVGGDKTKAVDHVMDLRGYISKPTDNAALGTKSARRKRSDAA
jgi:hypothetical protein